MALTTVLQAEEDLFPAELNLAALRANFYISIVRGVGHGELSNFEILTGRLASRRAHDGTHIVTGGPALF
jgi:hypothetical protein